MERLTCEGNFCDIAQCSEVPGGSFCEDGACSQKKVWERLKAYEDRGCEPEEVLPKDKADEIALKLMRLADLESLCSYDRLRELFEADKDGRVVVLPCKDCAKHYVVLGRDMCARNASGWGDHLIGLTATIPDAFCSRGVRKEATSADG